jgi:hypothetical protein
MSLPMSHSISCLAALSSAFTHLVNPSIGRPRGYIRVRMKMRLSERTCAYAEFHIAGQPRFRTFPRTYHVSTTLLM